LWVGVGETKEKHAFFTGLIKFLSSLSAGKALENMFLGWKIKVFKLNFKGKTYLIEIKKTHYIIKVLNLKVPPTVSPKNKKASNLI